MISMMSSFSYLYATSCTAISSCTVGVWLCAWHNEMCRRETVNYRAEFLLNPISRFSYYKCFTSTCQQSSFQCNVEVLANQIQKRMQTQASVSRVFLFLWVGEYARIAGAIVVQKTFTMVTAIRYTVALMCSASAFAPCAGCPSICRSFDYIRRFERQCC